MATPSNPYNFMQDYGRAGYDRRHQVNLVATIKLPLHLQLNPMLVAASGAPYDLTVGHDLNGDSFGTDRPAFATDLSRPSVVFTRFGAFDTDPIPGQTIVPHNYLMGAGMWNVNARLGRTFSFGEKPGTGPNASADTRFKLNFNVDVNNVFNHLNPGGYVGDLSSPLFGQPTSVLLFRENVEPAASSVRHFVHVLIRAAHAQDKPLRLRIPHRVSIPSRAPARSSPAASPHRTRGDSAFCARCSTQPQHPSPW